MNIYDKMIKTETLNLFRRLLRVGLGLDSPNGEVSFPKRDDVPEFWKEIYELGVRQGVATILFDGFQEMKEAQVIPVDCQPTKPELMKWVGHVLLVEKTYAKQEAAVSGLAKFYDSHNIRMMLLKGLGLSLLYPHPSHRPCGDIDIWLYGEQDRADNLLQAEKGVKIDKGHHHHTVFTFDGVMVENHYDFLNIHAHLSNRDIERELHKLAQQDGIEITINGAKVFMPPVDCNALFLLRHAASHFAAAEIALRHVTDWAMFVKEYHKEINWAYLEKIAREQNMHKFLHCLNAICIDYLGLPEEMFPPFERDKVLEERVMQDILDSTQSGKERRGLNPIQDFIFRFRRWWGNRWKHHMVYREGLLFTFLVQVRSHLMTPEGKRE